MSELYELRRETEYEVCTVQRGTLEDLENWVSRVIVRNGYSCNILTDLNMRPVWSCGDRVFYLKLIKKAV